MKKNLLFVLAIGFLLLASPVTCHGCSCGYERDPVKALNLAGVVFSGTVLEINQYVHEDRKKGEIYDYRNVVRFEVQNVWKGTDQTEFIVMTNAGGDTACGFDFQAGESYLVYAYKIENTNGVEWHTSTCSRTALLASASADLTQLPAGQAPTKPTDLSEQMKEYKTNFMVFQARMVYHGYVLPYMAYIIAASALILLGGWLAILRRSKK